MDRWIAFLSIAVCSCAPQTDDQNEATIESASFDESIYESSGSVFSIPQNEIEAVAASAVNGSDVQLQRLVDFYMFSFNANDETAAAQLQRWQSLGADRNLKGSRYNLIYSASGDAGPDCIEIRAHMDLLDEQSQEVLKGHNPYVSGCVEN